MDSTRVVKVVCEPACEDSIGCKQLVGSLTKALKKKRMDFESLEETKQIAGTDSVFLLGRSREWVAKSIEACNRNGNVPVVLSGGFLREMSGSYHLLCPDMQSMMADLKKKMEAAGRERIAVYGINRAVDFDKNRAELLLDFAYDIESIYQTNGNLENCFRSFLPRAKFYDAVICVNGYAALSLAKRLEGECPEALKTLVILSFEEVLRHSRYNRWISMIDLGLESYGNTAVAICDLAGHKANISAITVEMKCEVCEIPPKKSGEVFGEIKEEKTLYEDPEIVSMAKIEQLLKDADDLDHHIIAMLLDNAKYIEIADSCYMTEGNVKYRVKKYMSICGCKTKKELLELLQEYLQ